MVMQLHRPFWKTASERKAVQAGDVEEVRRLNTLGADSLRLLRNFRHFKSGFSLLHLAAECGSMEMISLLQKVNCQINARDKERRTPQHIAVLNGQARAVDTLLIHGANQKLTDMKNKTLLCWAVERQDGPTIEVLLKNIITLEHDKMLIYSAVETMCQTKPFFVKNWEYGANPNAIRIFTSDSEKGEHSVGYTALHIAVEKEEFEIFQLLLQYALFTPAEPCGFTPLHIAVEIGNEDIVTLLLNAGIPVNSPTKTGFIPLHLAAQNPTEAGSFEIVEIISEISSNRTGEWQKGYFSLFVAAYHGREAAQQGHENIVKILLEHQAEVYPKCITGNDQFSTPLIAACLSGHEAIVEILLNHGADVWFFQNNLRLGLTPIFHGVAHFKTKAFKSLVKLGASLSAKTSKGQSLLHYAIDENKEIIYHITDHLIRLILECGEDVNLKDSLNISAFEKILHRRASVDSDDSEYDEEAEINGIPYDYEQLLKLLLEEGFNVNTQIGESAQTIFHFVAETVNAKVVKLLLQHDVDVNLLDGQGHTAFRQSVAKARLLLRDIRRELSEDENENLIIRGLHAAVVSNDFLFGRFISYNTSMMYREYQEAVELLRIVTKGLARIQASGAELN
ncbi:ankyrin-3-like [Belonocnema kinseyi]|uniref:ankyrin-3-like n=1 Tax=Belonocnema kinseyi TaxID=2817044 RepID=UPI00143D45F7|nr:ankyrin-3-like [Belonocnema kinseyi]